MALFVCVNWVLLSKYRTGVNSCSLSMYENCSVGFLFVALGVSLVQLLCIVLSLFCSSANFKAVFAETVLFGAGGTGDIRSSAFSLVFLRDVK